MAKDRTDSGGNFNLSQIPAGGVYIYAQANHCEQRNIVNEWWDRSSDCSSAASFIVVAGQNIPNVDFYLQKKPSAIVMPIQLLLLPD